MIRYALFALAFLLLAWQQPQLASANRMARGKAKVSKSQVKSRAAKQVRTRVNRPSRVRSVVRKGAAQLRLRAAVRAQTKSSRSKLAEGQLHNAATEIARDPLRNAKGQFVKGDKKLSIRERFAVWRSRRAVKKAALSEARSRSAKGDLAGTADALNALQALGGKGRLGVFARWQKARATKAAFRNIGSSAKRSLQAGDVEAAGQGYALAAQLRPGSRAAKKLAKGLVKDSFKLAKGYAKTGQPQLAWSALEMAATIASEGGAKFSEKKAQKLVESSFRNALPVLTSAARKAYKQGDLQQASALIAEARSIQRSGNAKPSRSVARQQARLVKKLGPTLAQFEAAQAQEAQRQAE